MIEPFIRGGIVEHAVRPQIGQDAASFIRGFVTIQDEQGSQTVDEGELTIFTFELIESDFSIASYQWDRGGVAISGATAASYNQSNIQFADWNGKVAGVTVTDTEGQSRRFTSGLVTVAISAPTIGTQPTNQTVAADAQVTFTATATGSGNIVGQWQVSTNAGVDWADIDGELSDNLVFTAAEADDGKQYRRRFTSEGGATNSNAATLTISAGAPLATLPVAPVLRFHPEHSTVTLDSGRVTAVSDLAGTQDANLPSGEQGPLEATDLAGNKFWRFDGGQMLNIGTGFTGSSRSMTVIAVCRGPSQGSTNHIFGLGSRELATQVNSLNTQLHGRFVIGTGRTVACANRQASSTVTNAEYFAVGAQKQVIGTSSGSGGVFMHVNEKPTSNITAVQSVVDINGAEIGRYANSATSYGTFMLYELIVWDRQLTNAEMLATCEALMAAHNVVAFTNQFVTEGDSISAGTTVTAGNDAPVMVLSEPGRGLIPGDWRVGNQAISGDTIEDMQSRADANGFYTSADRVLPGRNVLAFEIGRNNWDTDTAAQVVAKIVAYLNTATTGMLQRGWEVRPMVNIGTGTGFDPVPQDQRALLLSSGFLDDLDANTGDTFDGKVKVVSTHLIEDGAAGQVFFTFPPNPDYIAGDGTHPNQLGARIRLDGGTTPQYGIAYELIV